MNNPFFTFPALSTGRLTLRQPVLTDAPDLFAYRSLEDFQPVLRVPTFPNELDAQAHIFNNLKEFYNQKLIAWAISEHENDTYIGSISLHAFPRDSFRGSHRLEISSELNQAFRRRGYITEAKARVIDWAFENLPSLLRIHSEITVSNNSSIRVNEKLGFKKEGCLRCYESQGGDSADIVVMSITRYDHEAQHYRA